MERRGLTLAEILVVLLVVVAIAAIFVPWRTTSNWAYREANTKGTLRTLVTYEYVWQKNDLDGNGVNDFWVADIAGMYRVLRQPAGVEAQMIDIAMARSDWAPDGAGDGPGAAEFPPAPLACAPGKQVPGLAPMPQTAPIPKCGYYLAAFAKDAAGTDYALDLDGAGQRYENAKGFAFMAFPDTYDGTGTMAFIVNEDGTIWRIDAAIGRFNLTSGPVNNGSGAAARPGPGAKPPLMAWPAASPASAGYVQAE